VWIAEAALLHDLIEEKIYARQIRERARLGSRSTSELQLMFDEGIGTE
jgi:hypothetical protein